MASTWVASTLVIGRTVIPAGTPPAGVPPCLSGVGGSCPITKPAGTGSASRRAEVTENPLGVVGLPGLARLAGRVLLVEADEQVGQLAANGLHAEQRGQLGEVDEPVRIPAGPVVVGAVDDPEDAVVGLACLMEQRADLIHSGFHLVPLRRAGWLHRVLCTGRWDLLCQSRSGAAQGLPMAARPEAGGGSGAAGQPSPSSQGGGLPTAAWIASLIARSWRYCSGVSGSSRVRRTCSTWPGAAATRAAYPSSVSSASWPRRSVGQSRRRTQPRSSRRATACETRLLLAEAASASWVIRSVRPGASESRTRIS